MPAERGHFGPDQIVGWDGPSADVLTKAGWASPSGGGGGGGGTFPFTVVQQAGFQSGGNGTSFSVTFPSALAGSGNTAFMLVACDGSSTVTAPAGWTVDLNVQQNTYARFMLVHKATAGETSVTFTVGSASSFSILFFELAGSHALDQSSTGGVANTNNVVLPAITPTAGSVVFGMSCQVANSGQTYNPVLNSMGNWTCVAVTALTSGGRALFGHISTVAASNVSTKPPVISNPGGGLFASGGIAYATFSIL